jgi:hypothetical protein
MEYAVSLADGFVQTLRWLNAIASNEVLSFVLTAYNFTLPNNAIQNQNI